MFNPGDTIECIDGSMPKGPYTVHACNQKYVKVKYDHGGISGGFFLHRFKLIIEEKPTKMDSVEYEDILAGDEIYAKLRDEI